MPDNLADLVARMRRAMERQEAAAAARGDPLTRLARSVANLQRYAPPPGTDPTIAADIFAERDRVARGQPGVLSRREWHWQLGRRTWQRLWTLDGDPDPPPYPAPGATLLGYPVWVPPAAHPDHLALVPVLPPAVAALPAAAQAQAVQAAHDLAAFYRWPVGRALTVLALALRPNQAARTFVPVLTIINDGRPGPDDLPGPELDYLTVERQHDRTGQRRLILTGAGGRPRMVVQLDPVNGWSLFGSVSDDVVEVDGPHERDWDCDQLGHLCHFGEPLCRQCGQPMRSGLVEAPHDLQFATTAWDPTSEEYLASLDYDANQDRQRLAAIEDTLADAQAWESSWDDPSQAHTMTFADHQEADDASGAHP